MEGKTLSDGRSPPCDLPGDTGLFKDALKPSRAVPRGKPRGISTAREFSLLDNPDVEDAARARFGQGLELDGDALLAAGQWLRKLVFEI